MPQISFNPKATALELTDRNAEEVRVFLGADVALPSKDGNKVKFTQSKDAEEKHAHLPVEMEIGQYAVRYLGEITVVSAREFARLMA